MMHHGFRGNHRRPCGVTSLYHGAPWSQREPPQAMWCLLTLSRCTMVSEGITVGHVVSPRAIMVHHGFRGNQRRSCGVTSLYHGAPWFQREPPQVMWCHLALSWFQREPPHVMWSHLALSWCTMVSEVKGEACEKTKRQLCLTTSHFSLLVARQDDVSCNSTKPFPWLTCST